MHIFWRSIFFTGGYFYSLQALASTIHRLNSRLSVPNGFVITKLSVIASYTGNFLDGIIVYLTCILDSGRSQLHVCESIPFVCKFKKKLWILCHLFSPRLSRIIYDIMQWYFYTPPQGGKYPLSWETTPLPPSQLKLFCFLIPLPQTFVYTLQILNS